MKNILFAFAGGLFLFLMGCSKSGDIMSDKISPGVFAEGYTRSSTGQGGSGQQSEPGMITAGEWNDLAEWAFWKKINGEEKYDEMDDYWNFYTNNRIAVHLTDLNGNPVIDATVKLLKNGKPIFTSRTDNSGNAELWASLFQKEASLDPADLQIDINNGKKVVTSVKNYAQGINNITLRDTDPAPDKVNIAFVVDATGSMGDELSYLKTELYDVINRAKEGLPNTKLSLSALFYRDAGDDYITKGTDFSDNISRTINFIKDQNANGGGDFPEAVHTALNKAVSQLQWAASARARILFLLLDAPPHYTPEILKSLENSILEADQKGIKIIPITASGIDKKTEFLMRFFAISTNGTYVFITNDSGIGNDHIEATVGEYDVEYLNDLMVRLIKKYAD